ncbi:MAG: TfoX/Sxy family protein [Alphaproteobacteria bacterium]|nr:TfoX/Sxy family protein [Alphaproteobacteria bacterium]
MKTTNSKCLSDMKNLGAVSVRQLYEIDIKTPKQLKKLGAVETWYRLKMVFGKGITLNFLYALEGAIQNCDWRKLPTHIKNNLKKTANNN